MNKFTIFSIVLVILLAGGIGYLASQTKTDVAPGGLVTDIVLDDHIGGSATAPVTLVEYSDFQCPACGAYYPMLEQLRKDAGDNLRFVYRHFPLRGTHKNADMAAYASEAASLQGKFWEMHAMIFEHQADWSDSNDAKGIFTEYAKTLGLDMEKFAADLFADSTKTRVERDVASGLKAGVNATPSFYLNGKRIQNPRSLAEFKTVINEALNAKP